LRQVAPGRYLAEFEPAGEGAYLIRVAGSISGEAEPEIVVAQTAGWVLGYSPEYLPLEADSDLLAAVAEMTGGRNVSADPGMVFDRSLPGDRVSRSIWPALTLLALFLLPVDIAIRRLVLTRRDLQQAWLATLGRWQPVAAPLPERREQVSRLFQAKQRAGTAVSHESTGSEPPPIRRQDAVPAAEPSTEPGSPATVEPEKERPDPAPPPVDSAAPLASRLLAKKRQQESDRKDAA
jgi:hypothetical protein